MIGALFFKEWLKLRRVYAVLWGLHLAAGAYALVSLRGLFAGAHPETLWYQAVVLGLFPYHILRHLPWVGGLALAVAQHLPEMRGKRLRLTLHLPIAPHLAMVCALGLGGGLLLLLSAFDAALVLILSLDRFPVEIALVHLAALAPLEAAGLCAYLGATFVLFEPSPLRAGFMLGLAAMAAAILLIPADPGAWADVRAVALGLALLAGFAMAPFLALARQRLTGKNQ